MDKTARLAFARAETGGCGMDGKRLLVVVDYQKDFVDGALGFCRGRSGWICPIAAKIKAYHDAGDCVVFTLDTHRENYLSTPRRGASCPWPTASAAQHRGLGAVRRNGQAASAGRTWCFQKPTFPSMELADYIAEEDFETIELVGLVSHIVRAVQRGDGQGRRAEAEIIIDAACTAFLRSGPSRKALDPDGGPADDRDEPRAPAEEKR